MSIKAPPARTKARGRCDLMAIYVTGDIHGGIDMHKLSNRELKKNGISIAENDFLVILGDFGLPFFDSDLDPHSKTHGEYRYWIKWLSEKPYTILWIDGNHDNFNFWERQEVIERYGGKVQIHPDAPNVIHLMRGDIYEIDGKSCLAFGGAASADKAYRKANINWWEQENASEADKANVRENLRQCGGRVDYVFTHTPPTYIRRLIPKMYELTDLTADFLDQLSLEMTYRAWFSGHLHIELLLKSTRFAAFYNTVLNAEEVAAAFGE